MLLPSSAAQSSPPHYLVISPPPSIIMGGGSDEPITARASTTSSRSTPSSFFFFSLGTTFPHPTTSTQTDMPPAMQCILPRFSPNGHTRYGVVRESRAPIRAKTYPTSGDATIVHRHPGSPFRSHCGWARNRCAPCGWRSVRLARSAGDTVAPEIILVASVEW